MHLASRIGLGGTARPPAGFVAALCPVEVPGGPRGPQLLAESA
jgi:hypothetical protein